MKLEVTTNKMNFVEGTKIVAKIDSKGNLIYVDKPTLLEQALIDSMVKVGLNDSSF